MKNIEEIIFEENCLAERFRNGQYYLKDFEKSEINNFIIDIEEQTKKVGQINSKDVSNLVGIIEVLFQADYENDNAQEAISLRNEILYKMDNLKNM